MSLRIRLVVALFLVCNVESNLARAAGGSPDTPSEEFVSKDGGFKVSVRGKPAERRKETPRGTVIGFFLWERDGRLFSIAYSDHPKAAKDTEEGLQKLIDTFLEGFLRTMKAKVTKDSRNKIADRYVGRDFMADTTAIPSGKLRGRMFFVGKRLYRLTVVGTKEVVEGEEANRFFKTFEVLK